MSGVYWELREEYVAWGGSVLDGDDTLANFANHVDIYSGYGNDSIQNSGEVVLMNCGEGDDVVINFASNVTVDGGNGNDEIYTHTDIYNISIDGGFSGNDTIHSFSNNSTLNCGVFGDCLVKNYGNENTIIGARGNDYIINSTYGNSYVWGGSEGNDTLIGGNGQDVFWFGHNDGNDVMFNADSNDIIYLYDMNTTYYSYANLDSDSLTVHFSGAFCESSITVQCNEQFSPVFQFGSGERFTCDRSTGYWHNA